MTRRPVMKLRRVRILLFIVVLISCSIFLAGCWNYKEVEELAIVAGSAVDKNEDGTMHLTVEIVDISTDSGVTYKPVYIESDGKTFFDAVRKAVTIEGKKLYWSHAKAIIISQELAKEDITKYLDFPYRDAETREDIWLLVSMEKTAKEVLQCKGKLKPIQSLEIDDTMRSQKVSSRFPSIEFYEFIDRLFYKHVAPILPAIRVIEQQGEKTSQIEGTAVIKGKKLVGHLDAEETKCMLFLRNEVKGGVIPLSNIAGTKNEVTLEIYKSKSKIVPVAEGETIKMKVDIDLDVSLGEIIGSMDFTKEPEKSRLIASAKKKIEDKIEQTFYKVRDEYDADIFGFGRRIDMKQPQVWNQIKDEWDDLYKGLELEVKVNLKIRGSAATRMPLSTGE
jgi:spore germination protein KC